MPKVGLATEGDRRQLLKDAAYYIRSETATQLTDNPIIMPRLAPPGEEPKQTRGAAINGVLEELANFNNKEIKYFDFEEIVICSSDDKTNWLEHIDDEDSISDLPLKVENLYAEGPWDTINIFRVDGGLQEIRVNKKIMENSCRISISVPSADPVFGVYGCIPNMIFAVHPADRPLLQGFPENIRLSDSKAASVASSSLLPNAVEELSQQPKQYRLSHRTLLQRTNPYLDTEEDVGLHLRTLYKNIVELSKHLKPDLAYVDGTYVIGGEGKQVDVVDGNFALSGMDPVAVDTVLADLLDVDVESLGHLQYLKANQVGCADMSDIKIAVGDTDDVSVDFQPHPKEQQRLKWRRVKLSSENGGAVGYVEPGQELEEKEEEEEEKQTEEETTSATTESSEDGSSVKDRVRKRLEEKEGTDEEEAKTETEADEEETAEETTASSGEAESAGAPAGGDLSVQERIRRRLIKRGKLEGEIEETAEEPAESGAGETTEAPQQTGEAGETEEEPQQETPTEEETTTPSSGGDLSLRDRIKNRLIKRGKMEGEVKEPSGGKTEAESEKQQKADKEQKTGEKATASSQESEDTSGETSGSGDVREKIRERLKKRKQAMEGDGSEEETETTSSSEAPEEAGETEGKEEEKKTAETQTQVSAASASTRKKMMERFAKRRKAVDQKDVYPDSIEFVPPEEIDTESTPEEAPAEEPQPEAQAEQPSSSEEESAEAKSDGDDSAEEEGYVFDPDMPLMDRIRERLEKRGKL